MKKLFVGVIVTCLGFNSLSYAAEKSLTVGETLTMYFTEIFPNLSPDISQVTVEYQGIGSRAGLREALQRAIYYNMLPNSATLLQPDSPMSDRAFAQLLRRDF